MPGAAVLLGDRRAQEAELAHPLRRPRGGPRGARPTRGCGARSPPRRSRAQCRARGDSRLTARGRSRGRRYACSEAAEQLGLLGLELGVGDDAACVQVGQRVEAGGDVTCRRGGRDRRRGVARFAGRNGFGCDRWRSRRRRCGAGDGGRTRGRRGRRARACLCRLERGAELGRAPDGRKTVAAFSAGRGQDGQIAVPERAAQGRDVSLTSVTELSSVSELCLRSRPS